MIVFTRWPGQPPQIVEDQVTYPITTTMLSVANVKVVRGYSYFGFSFVYVIFKDGTDIYWARSRVLEYLSSLQGRMPSGVTPELGPDATPVGWVYEYALVDHSGKNDLAKLRTLQDWYLRYQLETVPGVAEVAAIGGFVRQYQVNLDPDKLRAYGIPLRTVIDRVRESTNEVGGRLLEMGGAEYMVRGLGYIRSLDDLNGIPVAVDGKGTPIRIQDVAHVHLGPELRRGVAELDGERAGVVLDRRDVVDRLPKPPVQEPLERGLLDVDQVGEVENVLDPGKGLTGAGQCDLGGQRKQPPLGRACSGEIRRSQACGTADERVRRRNLPRYRNRPLYRKHEPRPEPVCRRTVARAAAAVKSLRGEERVAAPFTP